MVVSAREEASKIGVEIMKKGGNAFDAMVATELALAVAYPYRKPWWWWIYGL
jgi:gamma-glutamyltranspeptidase/glutathione hydrolase